MAVTRSNLFNVAAWITPIASLGVVVAALLQVSSTNKQVVALQHQTMISHFAASTELLGSKEISVRIGAIQALGYLAEVQPELFHLRVMRLLCAFIREPVPMTPVPRKLRADVQTALDMVIYRSKNGQRLEEQYRRRYTDRRRGGVEPLAPPIIDLSGSDLQWGKLYRAELNNAILDRADLSYASGNGAVFSEASFVGTVAHKATFITANFDSADMLGGDWSGSVLQNSSFMQTKMPSRLVEAHLERSNLSQSVLGAVNLSDAWIEKADLSGAKFGIATRITTDTRTGARSSTKLFPIITQAALDTAIADAGSPPMLPVGMTDATTGHTLVWKTEERGRAWAEYKKLLDER